MAKICKTLTGNNQLIAVLRKTIGQKRRREKRQTSIGLIIKLNQQK